MAEKDKIYVSVILPLRLEWEPCYYLPSGMDGAESVTAGTRVSVRFAGKTYIGVVSAAGIRPEVDEQRILPVLSLADGLWPVSMDELKLWRFVADYYLCTIGEVYKAAYPAVKINMEMACARLSARRAMMLERKASALNIRKDRLMRSATLYGAGR